MRLALTLLLFVIGGLAAAGSPQPALGATFDVNSTTDAVDANPGDGVCASAAGECTLRAAIQETNALPGADTVFLPTDTYRLAIGGRNEDASATGDLDILGALTLIGERICPLTPDGSSSGGRCLPASTIDGAGVDRVMTVHNSATLDMSYVTVQNGTAINADAGGGIANVGTLSLIDVRLSANTSGVGAGLFNRYGQSKLVGVTVTGNDAGSGGGIENFESGFIEISESLVSANSAEYGAGVSNWGEGAISITTSAIVGNTASVEGGGVSNVGQGTVSVTNSTITVGTAPIGAAVLNATLVIPGGPLRASSAVQQPTAQATFEIKSSTLTANTASAGSGIHNAATQGTPTPGVVTILNTIVGGRSQANNCSGPVLSLGHNLTTDASCGLTGPGDIVVADPLLGPLAGNGGPTQTHALLPGSLAIDTADNAACPSSDQRGEPRPSDGDGDGSAVCDIGAYEAQAPLPATPTPSPAPTPTPKALPDSGGRSLGDGDADLDAVAISSSIAIALAVAVSAVAGRRSIE